MPLQDTAPGQSLEHGCQSVHSCGEQQVRSDSSVSVTNPEIERLRPRRQVRLSQVRLFEPAEAAIRADVVAIQLNSPMRRSEEVVRNSGVVLQDRKAVREDALADRRKLRLVEHVRGCFEERGSALQAGEESQESRVLPQAFVGQVDGEVKELMNRLVAVGPEVEFHPLVADLSRRMVVGCPLDDLPGIVQPYISEAEDGVVCSNQQLKNRQEQPIGHLPPKLAVHLAG